MKIGYTLNNYQDCWWEWKKHFFNPWEIEKKGFYSILQLTDNPQYTKSLTEADRGGQTMVCDGPNDAWWIKCQEITTELGQKQLIQA